MTLTHEAGYGNCEITELRQLIEGQAHTVTRHRLMDLLGDYERLLQVIDGKAVFRHPDGSETRRIKLYSV